jgi:hypothetical protein
LFGFAGIFLGGLLLFIGVAKLGTGFGRESALSSALAHLVRRARFVVPLWRLIACLELLAGSFVLVASPEVGGISAGFTFIGAAGYAILALRVVPGRPCGCFGGASIASGRTVARAVLLAGAAWGYAALGSAALPGRNDVGAWVGLLVLGAVTVSLSPEASDFMRRTVAIRRSRACLQASIKAADVTALICGSKAWAATATYRTSDEATDTWREGCWQDVCFPADFEGKLASAVFSSRLPPGRAICRAFVRRGLTGDPIVVLPDERDDRAVGGATVGDSPSAASLQSATSRVPVALNVA